MEQVKFYTGETGRRTWAISLLVLLTLGVFVADILTPLGVAVWALYMLPLVIGSRVFRNASIILYTALVTVLVFIGLVLPAQGDTFHLALLNRSMVVVVFWTATYVLTRYRKIEVALEASHQALEQRVSERTRELVEANQELSREIEERRIAEQEIRKRDRQLLDAQQLARVGSWEWDPATHAFSSSEVFREIFGLSKGPSHIELNDVLARVHPEDRETLADAMKRGTNGQGHFSFEHKILLSDGNARALHWQGHAVRDGSGSTVKLAGTCQDITRRKQVEEEIARARDLYIKILNEFPNLIRRAGVDGMCDYVNKGWLAFTGRRLEDERGTGWLEGVHPDDRAEVERRYRQAFEARQSFSMEYRLRFHDGSYRSILSYGVPIFNPDGTFGGYISSCYDNEDQRKAHETMEQQARILAQSNADLEQFAYVASHDLQEPLRMVQGFVQLLARRYSAALDDEGRQFMGYAVDGARRMQSLIRDLLAYSRVSRGAVQNRKVDLTAAVGQALFNLTQAIEESGALVVTGDLPVVCADETQMIQLFQNLIGNAVKFRGAVAPQIRISSSKPGDMWTIAVEDNGIGIAPEYCEKIFVIFQRLHARDDYPGTGIGLAICKKIVERHGGRIWVESRPGEGATFYFTLPVC